jgi:hypothetical protein
MDDDFPAGESFPGEDPGIDGVTDYFTISMDAFEPGPLPKSEFEGEGIRITRGDPVICAATAAMVVSEMSASAMILGGSDKNTVFVLEFDPPLKQFAIERIGVKNGASLPKWRMEAYDTANLKVGSRSEWRWGFDSRPKTFTIHSNQISRIVITTDNRHGTGTFATFNSLPILSWHFGR